MIPDRAQGHHGSSGEENRTRIRNIQPSKIAKVNPSFHLTADALRGVVLQMKILKDILTYAYRGSGKYVLILCVALSLIAKLAGIAPLVGPIAGLLLSAYF